MTKSDPTVEAGEEPYDALLQVVALRLKEVRLAHRLTQKEFAEKAGLKQSYVFELETGRTNITLRTLAKMADVVGLEARDLLPEGKSTPASPAAFVMLCGVLEKLTAVLQAREEEAAKRQALDAELLSELKSFAALKISLEQATQPVHEPVEVKPSRAKAGRAGGGATHRQE